MPHAVTTADVDSIRARVENLNARLGAWSEMIGELRSCTPLLPKYENAFQMFSPGNKVVLESRLEAAHKVASRITVKAADLVADIQVVLDTARAADAFDPSKPKPQRTAGVELANTPDYSNTSLKILLRELEASLPNM